MLVCVPKDCGRHRSSLRLDTFRFIHRAWHHSLSAHLESHVRHLSPPLSARDMQIIVIIRHPGARRAPNKSTNAGGQIKRRAGGRAAAEMNREGNEEEMRILIKCPWPLISSRRRNKRPSLTRAVAAEREIVITRLVIQRARALSI
jgi:hypothetical protein